jgi:hypothetical protein
MQAIPLCRTQRAPGRQVHRSAELEGLMPASVEPDVFKAAR